MPEEAGGKNVEIHNIPDLFSNKLRLAAMVSLVSGEKSFQELKKITNASAGVFHRYAIGLLKRNAVSV